jgi:hypothetical protein
MLLVKKILDNLTSNLNLRQKQILNSRYNLDGRGQKTLAFLGKKFGITRERVRQIQNLILKNLRKNSQKNKDFKDLIAKIKDTLKKNGGLLRKDIFLNLTSKSINGLNEDNLFLLKEISEEFNFYEEDKNFHSFYYLKEINLKNIFNFIDKWIKILEKNKDKVLEGGYHKLFEDFIKNEKISKNYAINYISISKKIKVNQYGDIGLVSWPEINPKVIRDKVYLVLKKKKAPLHFTKISEEVNKLSSRKKLISTPTIHNELIKDKRFVLVGRGMYALREWGYEPGTAKDLIIKLLKEEGPLRPQEIILAIQKTRFLKQNTILANLQNKNYFERLADGTYKIKEA